MQQLQIGSRKMGVSCTTLQWILLYFTVSMVSGTSATTAEYTNLCQWPPNISNGHMASSMSTLSQTVVYECNEGYILRGHAQQECTGNAAWEPPEQPACVPHGETHTCRVPYVSYGFVKPKKTSDYFATGDNITVQCKDNYGILLDHLVVSSVQLQCSQDGKWTYHSWQIDPQCIVPNCGTAPEIPHAKIENLLISFHEQKAKYSCDTGFTFVRPQSSSLMCDAGEWTGDIPSCVPIEACDVPPVVQDATQSLAVPLSSYLYQIYKSYRVGTEITYKCHVGYKLVGPSTLQCLQNGLWSHGPPSCVLEQEPNNYCPSVENTANGKCVCETKSDLSYCEPFYQGLHVECLCNSGYKMIGQPIVTCHKDGKWDYIMPRCIEDMAINSKTDAPTEDSTHMSTLAIVVATACSVLGVLLLTMVIMVFRRRKPHPPRLMRPSSTPPPYSRVHGNAMDEHDRVLLIGYENSNVQLPTYEEAIVGRPQPGGYVARSGLGQVGEYRPLPSIPSNYRSNTSVNGEPSNRHSIITTSTMNRDGLSEGFGSIDTVNVSVSDASTAVTIETFDSAGSHHSNMSRRATAGSLSSSNGSIVTEDAPLLESTQRREEVDLAINEADMQDKIEN